MSATKSTTSSTSSMPEFMACLSKLAGENRVSNKTIKAKRALKKSNKKEREERIKREHKLAAQMDKELTKQVRN